MAWSKDNQRLWWALEQTFNQKGNTAQSDRLSWGLLNSNTIKKYLSELNYQVKQWARG